MAPHAPSPPVPTSLIIVYSHDNAKKFLWLIFVLYSLDSWFVPSFSAVAESEALLKQVIPFDQGFAEVHKYAGIFRFRFWFGRWIGMY